MAKLFYATNNPGLVFVGGPGNWGPHPNEVLENAMEYFPEGNDIAQRWLDEGHEPGFYWADDDWPGYEGHGSFNPIEVLLWNMTYRW